jgi:uncharacterized protein DUF3224
MNTGATLAIAVTALVGSSWVAAAEGGTMAEKHHATGRTEVTKYVPTTFDEVADGPALLEVQLTETFTGDIQGEGIGRVIQAARKDGSATFSGLERVRGSMAGRTGTFLLQVTGTVARKEMHAQWFIVPGSGTGTLTGLRGDGGFTAQLGQHGSIWLDYFFE